jgi:hypothetical protein
MPGLKAKTRLLTKRDLIDDESATRRQLVREETDHDHRAAALVRRWTTGHLPNEISEPNIPAWSPV